MEGLHARDDRTGDELSASARGRVMGVLNSADQAQWEEDGWCVVHGLLPSGTIAAAQAVLPTLVPTAEEFADDVDPERNEPFRVDSHSVMPRFPFEDGALNDIVVHDRIIDLAEQLLGLSDLRLYQAMSECQVRPGCAERRAAAPRRLREPHPRRAPARARLPAAGDVRLPERRHRRDGGDPGGVAAADPAHPRRADVPEPDGVRGPLRRRGAGRRPRRLHPGLSPRRVPPGRADDGAGCRPASCCTSRTSRPATDWLGSHGLPSAGEDMSWYRFVQHATERQLTVLGFPAPGAPYWTDETLAGVAARYPMLDLSPWRNAAGHGGADA